jgi:hypothetical protein
MGADTHVPLVEFPDPEVSPNPEKPFDTGDAYSPIDFDSFSHATLGRFPYVITGRAAWNSEAPTGFKRVASTPSYILWKRVASPPENRHVLLEGTEPAAFADCAAPELRILTSNPGRASLFPGAVVGRKGGWEPGLTLAAGDSASQTLRLRPDALGARPAPGAAGSARRSAAQHDQPRQRRPVLAGRQDRQPRRHSPVHDLRRRTDHPAEPHGLRRQGEPR